jgi:NhaA family Na+:H+ antiporter
LSTIKRVTNILQEFSLPLIAGVIMGLLVANVDGEAYHHIVHFKLFGVTTPHFLINDIFMVFFFGIAAKEITESVLPGGDLNPPSKAINPLLGTIGGVAGPVGVFLVLAAIFQDELTALAGVEGTVGAAEGILKSMTPGATVANTDPAVIFRGWGIPTATDIALAWLVARLVFGNGHPAVNFLLLLAVADDAIGLGIIAVFYPDPGNPPAPMWLGLVLVGMAICYGLRKRGVQAWVPYIAFGGFLSWLGLLQAHLHPALALVPIVPFLPGPDHDAGLFKEEEEIETHADGHVEHHHGHSPLEEFEHQLKLPVDMGLFFFAFANAGVAFAEINLVTWIILASLIIGKTIGITFFSMLGKLIGAPLPEGMNLKHLVVAGVVAGLGLTVALFVSGEAYPGDSVLQGPAKMGAVFSAVAAPIALLLGKVFKLKGERA